MATLDPSSASLRTVFDLSIPEQEKQLPTNTEIAIAFEKAGIPVGSFEYFAVPARVVFVLMPIAGKGKLFGESVPIGREDCKKISDVLVELGAPIIEIRVKKG